MAKLAQLNNKEGSLTIRREPSLPIPVNECFTLSSGRERGTPFKLSLDKPPTLRPGTQPRQLDPLHHSADQPKVASHLAYIGVDGC